MLTRAVDMHKVKIVVAIITVISLFIGPMVMNQLVLADMQQAISQTQIIHVPGDIGDLQTAINQISNGGIIELAAGTYVPPQNGWQMHDLQKGFTIQAAEGATVILDGQGSRELLRYQNSSISKGGPVTFDGLILANGYTTTEGTAAGLTLYNAEATFIDCVFRDNNARVNTTVGGAVYIAEHSIVFFIDTIWRDNTSRVGGAAIGARTDIEIYIHNSEFINNHVNAEGHIVGSTGGAINIGNGLLRVTNSRFVGNEAGAYGGALYAIGTWSDPISVPRTDVILANTTFINNRAVRHPSVYANFPTEGGAINVEDQTSLHVYHSRFINNDAHIGGGINVYRSAVEVYDSVFMGNRASGTQGGASFGGSISLNSADGPDNGYNNYPPSSLIVRDSLFYGRYNGVTSNGISGGCIFGGGDGNRIDGNSTVPDMGTVEENRAKVDLDGVVLYDCAATISPSGDYSGIGGALMVAVANLSMKDSMILSSEATGSTASGGGTAIIFNSVANFENTIIAHNTSGQFGGGILVQGSKLDIDNSKIFRNEVSPMISESPWASFGAAIFSSPDTSMMLNTRGTVQNTTFSGNVGMSIFDDDRSDGPINDLQYKNVQFFESTFNDDVYKSSLSPQLDPDGLNTLIIQRSNGTSIDKADVAVALPYEPVLAGFDSVPNEVLPVLPPGDSSDMAAAYIFGVSSNTDHIELITSMQPGNQNITVGGVSQQVYISEAENPTATFNAQFSTDLNRTDLNWNVSEGHILDLAVDQGINLTSTAATGSAQFATSVERVYHFFVITEEGGVVVTADADAPVLWAPDSRTFLLEVHAGTTSGNFVLRNIGGSLLSWTASTTTGDLITLHDTSGQFFDEGTLSFSVDVGNKSSGTYCGYIDVESADGSVLRIEIIIKVVNEVYDVFVPMASR